MLVFLKNFLSRALASDTFRQLVVRCFQAFKKAFPVKGKGK